MKARIIDWKPQYINVILNRKKKDVINEMTMSTQKQERKWWKSREKNEKS